MQTPQHDPFPYRAGKTDPTSGGKKLLASSDALAAAKATNPVTSGIVDEARKRVAAKEASQTSPPPQPTQEAPVQEQQAPPPEQFSGNGVHPILLALRREFGVDQIPAIEREIGGRIYTFRAADARDFIFARGVSELISPVAPDEVRDFAIACACTCAIDGIPTYLLFNVSVRGQVITDPLYPPISIRMEAARLFFEEMQNKVNDLRRQITLVYRTEFRKSLVDSYLDRIGEMKRKFVCTTQGCDNVIFEVPLYNPEDKTTKPYYCLYHGTVMEMAPGQQSPFV